MNGYSECSNKYNSDEKIIFLTAELIDITEHGRWEKSHSVYVEKDEEARNIFRIILEVTVEQILRDLLVNASMERWKVTDTDFTKNLVEQLQNLIGTFHGPEKHVGTKGPLQEHYNASTSTSRLTLVNTYIFFGK